MKCTAVFICILFFLSGCSSEGRDLERVLALRSDLLAAEECGFDAKITADYEDKLYCFSVTCTGKKNGDLEFGLLEPESISGISGFVSDTGAGITFEDKALQFEAMAEDRATPVSAPWIFFNALRNGYVKTAGMEDRMLRVTIADSYDADALQLDIWLMENDMPVRAEILHDGRRIMTLEVDNFEMR